MNRVQDFKTEILPLLEPLFRKLFDIREGEASRAGFMFLYIFLNISTLLIIKPVSYALFLSEFGATRLPYAFILVSIIAVVVTILYSRKLNTANLNFIIERTLQILVLCLFIIWALLYFDIERNWTLYIFFTMVAIFALVSTSQFWILANIVFNAREAKRLFGFLGAGAIAGGIFGGYLTKLLAPTIGSENLIFICIAFLGICIPVARAVWKEKVNLDSANSTIRIEPVAAPVNSPIKLITGSAHLSYLAAIVGISVLVAKLVEYQFSAVASMWIDQEDQLTAFFGFWLSNLNIASLLIQVFLTRKVVGVFGVGTSLLFLPVAIFIGALAILIHPALWSAILIKISDGSLKQSINKAGMELLALPIPLEIKNQAKSFIDIFIDSFATGIGGALLILLTLGLNFSVARISFITILLIFVWIYLITRVKKEYIKSIRYRMVQSKVQPVSAHFDLTNESVLGGLIKLLQSDNPKHILRALRMVKEIKNERLLPCFEELLQHPENEIRLEVLRNLYFYKVDYSQKVNILIQDPDPQIKVEAFHYLFQHVTEDRVGLLQSYLDHNDYALKSAALICASAESRDNLPLKSIFKIRERVEEDIKRIQALTDKDLVLSIKITAARVIGNANLPELYPYLHILLSERVPSLLQAAIESAGQSRNPEFIPTLIRFLKKKNMLKYSAAALLKFAPSIFDILNDHLNNPYEDIIIRSNISKVFASLGSQRAVDMLLPNLDSKNPLLRHEIVLSLYELKITNPDLQFNQKRILNTIFAEAKDYAQILAVLYKQKHTATKHPGLDPGIEKFRDHLINNLQNHLDSDLERIFRLLGLRYPMEDIYSVYLGIKSRKSDIQVNAIEFLDNLLEIDLKRVIIPLVETTVVGTLVDQFLERFDLKVPSEFECLTMLLTGEDPSLQLDALQLVTLLKDERFLPHIGNMVNSTDLKIKRKALQALQQMDFSV